MAFPIEWHGVQAPALAQYSTFRDEPTGSFPFPFVLVEQVERRNRREEQVPITQKYAALPSLEDALEHICAVPEGRRHFYELIVGEYARRPYFDFEVEDLTPAKEREARLRMDTLAQPDGDGSLARMFYDMAVECNVRFNTTEPLPDGEPPAQRRRVEVAFSRTVWLNSDKPGKISFHAIITNYAFRNTHEQKKFMDLLYERYKAQFTLQCGTCVLDRGVYSRNRVFRMRGCNKYKEPGRHDEPILRRVDPGAPELRHDHESVVHARWCGSIECFHPTCERYAVLSPFFCPPSEHPNAPVSSANSRAGGGRGGGRRVAAGGGAHVDQVREIIEGFLCPDDHSKFGQLVADGEDFTYAFFKLEKMAGRARFCPIQGSGHRSTNRGRLRLEIATGVLSYACFSDECAVDGWKVVYRPQREFRFIKRALEYASNLYREMNAHNNVDAWRERVVEIINTVAVALPQKKWVLEKTVKETPIERYNAPTVIVKFTRWSRVEYDGFKTRSDPYEHDVAWNNKGQAVKTETIAKVWLNHKAKLTTEEYSLRPDATDDLDPELCFNTFTGFQITPQLALQYGSDHESLEHEMRCFIRDVWAQGDVALYDYLMNWMASCLQRPWVKLGSALFLHSSPGRGKGFPVKMMIDIIGLHHASTPSSQTIVKGWNNSIVENKCFCFCDEANFTGESSKQVMEFIKRLITEPYIECRARNTTETQVPNFINIILASNERNAIPVDERDRRFTVIELAEGHASRRNCWTAGRIKSLAARMDPFIWAKMLYGHTIPDNFSGEPRWTRAALDLRLLTLDQFPSFMVSLTEDQRAGVRHAFVSADMDGGGRSREDEERDQVLWGGTFPKEWFLELYNRRNPNRILNETHFWRKVRAFWGDAPDFNPNIRRRRPPPNEGTYQHCAQFPPFRQHERCVRYAIGLPDNVQLSSIY